MGWGFDGMGVRWPPLRGPGAAIEPPAIEGAGPPQPVQRLGAVALHGGKAPTAPTAEPVQRLGAGAPTAEPL